MAKDSGLDKKDKISIAAFVVVSIALAIMVWVGFFGEDESEVASPTQQSQTAEEEIEETTVSEHFGSGGDTDRFILTEEDPFIEDCRQQDVDQGVSVSSNTVCLR